MIGSPLAEGAVQAIAMPPVKASMLVVGAMGTSGSLAAAMKATLEYGPHPKMLSARTRKP